MNNVLQIEGVSVRGKVKLSLLSLDSRDFFMDSGSKTKIIIFHTVKYMIKVVISEETNFNSWGVIATVFWSVLTNFYNEALFGVLLASFQWMRWR